MKFSLLALALLAASSAFADVAINGSAALESRYVNRNGIAQSDNSAPSLGGTLTVTDNLGPVSLYSTFVGHTLAFKNHDSYTKGLNLKTTGEVGVGSTVVGVTAQGGVRRYWYFGSDSATGASPGSNDYTEVFVTAKTAMMGGIAYGEYDRNVANPTGTTGHNAYWNVGYMHSVIVPELMIGVAADWRNYQGVGTKYNNTFLSANYSLSKNLGVYANESIGGKDCNNVKIFNQFAMGAKYTF